MILKTVICLIAGLFAGVGTGLSGLSAASVISPMLISFLGVSAYEAVGIALASDVLASAVSAYTYAKNKNIDIKNGLVMLGSVLVFTLIVLAVRLGGVKQGVERVSKVMMPVLVVLAVFVAGYSMTRPGALEGVKYFLIPNFSNFSWMTVVAAMGQMFYSLSIAMGILYTYGSYIEKDVDIEKSTKQVELFDTAIAMLAGLMIIPAVFAFSGGDPAMLQAGPSLMFITIPKVFASMGFGTGAGITFFLLVLLAALTSAISLAESGVSTFEDQLGWSRRRSTLLMGVVIVLFGSASALGFGVLDFVTVLGMSVLDFFDFLTNSLMMPIAALATCLLVTRVAGLDRIAKEVEQSSSFRRKGMYCFFMKYLAPICIVLILLSSVANVFGWITL